MSGSVLLIVVAHPGQRALFNRVLGTSPHHVVMATDGEDGFVRFEEVKPDLVIAPVEGQGLGGVLLCRRIRELNRGGTTPIVLMGEGKRDPQELAALGADGWLPYPFDRRSVLERIVPLLAFGRPEQAEQDDDALSEAVVAASTPIGVPEEETLAARKIMAATTEPRGSLTGQVGVASARAEPDSADLDPRGAEPASSADLPAEAEEGTGAESSEDLAFDRAGTRRTVLSEEERGALGASLEEEPLPKGPRRGRRTESPDSERVVTVVGAKNPFVEDQQVGRKGTEDLVEAASDAPALDGVAAGTPLVSERGDGTNEITTDSANIMDPPTLTPGEAFEEHFTVDDLHTESARLDRRRFESKLEAAEAEPEEPVLPVRPSAGMRASSGVTRPGTEPPARESGQRSGPLAAPERSKSAGDAPPPVQAPAAVEHPTSEVRSKVKASLDDSRPPGGSRSRSGAGAGPAEGSTSGTAARSDPSAVPASPNGGSRTEPAEGDVARGGPGGMIAETPLPDDRASARSSLIEEPRLGSGREDSAGRRMIEEQPREATPSVARAPDRSQRRGLDETQLGRRLTKRVRSIYAQREEVDHYEFLGVPRDFTEKALQNAYVEMSLEFHPDRFFLLRSGELKGMIYAVYRRIIEAYTVLSDEAKRAAYDQRLAGVAAPSSGEQVFEGERAVEDEPSSALTPENDRTEDLDVAVENPKAQALIARARRALAEGDLHGARLDLHLARHYERANEQLNLAIARVVAMQRDRLQGTDDQ